MRFFIILIIVTLATMAAIPSHAQVYLDGDAPTSTLVQLKPGDYAKFKLPFDVTFSSIHGDDENKDSELMFANIHIKVGLTNDKVELQVYDNGKLEYHETLAQQNGFVWDQPERGTAYVELILDCYGNLKIYSGNKEIYHVNGLSTSTSLTVLGDKDATLDGHGTYYTCTNTPPPDYQSQSLSSNTKMVAAALGGIVLLGVGLALAFRG